MQSRRTLDVSPRSERGEEVRTCFGSLFGVPGTVSSKVPLFLRKRERVRVLLDRTDTT